MKRAAHDFEAAGAPFDVREMYLALEAALSPIWSDPLLDEYADYDRHHKPRESEGRRG